MGAEIGIIVNQECNKPVCFNFGLIRSIIKSKDIVEFQNTLKTLDMKNMELRDARDCRGASLLHVAAECDNKELVTYLIKSGFEINLQDEHGQTALMLALKNNHFFTVKVLPDLRADFRICDTLGICALQIVIAADPVTSVNSDTSPYWLSQYFGVVSFILDQINDYYLSNSKKIVDQLLRIRCPITHVVFMKNSEVMKIMLEKGCPINVRDRLFGKTALHLAVQSCQLDKVKILLDRGADVNIVDYHKKTPFMYIYKNMQCCQTMPPWEVQLVKVLLKHKHKFLTTNNHGPCFVDQMSQIFSKGSKDAVRLVIKETDDDLFLAKNKDQFTLLHAIAENTNSGMKELIKGRKINVNGKSRYGETALGHAIEHDNYEIIEYLFSVGASADFENSNEDTLRRSFLTDGYCHDLTQKLRCTKLLLEYGADREIMIINRNRTMFTLDMALENLRFPLVQPILAQFAIRQSMGAFIPRVIHKRIQFYNQSKIYFDLCASQLEEAKTVNIVKSMTVFELLIASDKMISRCARDKSLVSTLSQSIDRLNTLDPYYMRCLRKRFSQISSIAESREKAEGIICQLIGELYECNSVVTRIIVDFLEDEDVRRLL